LTEFDYALAERSFSHFYRAAWSVLEPTTELKWNWHIECIAEYLEAVDRGQIKRLIINMPPRNSKSMTVTVMFPAWCWIRRASRRFINVSYSESLAVKHNVDRRLLINSPWYQAAWGDRFSFSPDQNLKSEYTNDKRGHCVAAGMLGTITGKGGDVIICDDPHNPQKAESDVEREKTVDTFDSTLTTRLDDKKTGAMILVMQRLHERDLTGHLLKKGGWEHLCLPAEAPTRSVITFPISGKEVVREEGEILHPEREGPVELAAQKVALGSYGYAGQYDQNPAPRAGGLFKRSYWRYYVTLPERIDIWIQSWDMAFKDKATSDYVVGLVMARAGASIYVVDMVMDKLGFSKSKDAIRSLSQKWPRALLKVVEDKANGTGIVDDLKSEIAGLVLQNPEGSKWERASRCEPMLEAGNVYLPTPETCAKIMVDGKPKTITDAIMDQCAVFPNGANDDIVDALTQGLDRLRPKVHDRTKALGVL
jgi:predicted phage terminase large subunit-like protein